MATEKDLTDLKDDDVTILDEKISAAITIKGSLAAGDPRRLALTTTINDLTHL
jgi:hypothetical protein